MQELSLYEKYKENKFLQKATIELTNQCNWRCKHCYLDNSQTNIIELSKVYEIIDDARKLGAFEIRFSGGEVAVYPYLEQVIAYARKKYMSVRLLSNMSVLSESVFSCIKQYGIDGVETTLFSLQDSVHDSFVGSSGALRRSLNNIKRLKELGITVKIKTWAIKSNYNELEKMRDYFVAQGYLFGVGVQIYSDVNGHIKLPIDEQLSEAEYCHALFLDDQRRVFPIKKESYDFLCEDFLTSTYITSTGDVVACAKYREPLGNIHAESLSTIWTTSKKLQTIKNYRWKDCKECEACKNKAFCNRCGAMSYIKGKDYLENCKETCLLASIRATHYTNAPEGGLY